MIKTTIAEVPKYVDQEVTIGAWVANKRSSGKIAFLQLRDGTGFIQGVIVKAEVPEEVFQDSEISYTRIIIICNRDCPKG